MSVEDKNTSMISLQLPSLLNQSMLGRNERSLDCCISPCPRTVRQEKNVDNEVLGGGPKKNLEDHQFVEDYNFNFENYTPGLMEQFVTLGGLSEHTQYNGSTIMEMEETALKKR